MKGMKTEIYVTHLRNRTNLPEAHFLLINTELVKSMNIQCGTKCEALLLQLTTK